MWNSYQPSAVSSQWFDKLTIPSEVEGLLIAESRELKAKKELI